MKRPIVHTGARFCRVCRRKRALLCRRASLRTTSRYLRATWPIYSRAARRDR